MEINQSTLVLLTSIIALLGVLFGATISSSVNFFVGWFTRRSEERRQVRALVVESALESWKQKPQGARFDVYLLHMAKTADVVFDPTTNPSNLEERLKPIDDMVDIMLARGDRLRAQDEQRNKQRLALDHAAASQHQIAD